LTWLVLMLVTLTVILGGTTGEDDDRAVAPTHANDPEHLVCRVVLTSGRPLGRETPMEGCPLR
jgi:hypothetical protein